MKRIFLFWLSYLLSLSAFAQESDLSNPSNPTIARTLTGIHVFDANNAVIVGQSGTILKTTDGGTNWTIKNSGTNLPLLAVHFADPINGWAVGEDRIILKSSNGGNSWMQQFSTELSTFAEDVYFVNADTGLAAGILGFNNMLRTFDGGQTWTGVSLGVAWVKQVHFVDARHGWAVGITASFISISVFGDIIIQNPRSTIWRTIDGGATWSVMLSGPVRNTPEWLRGVFFTDLNTGWIVGDNNVILKTTDGGVTWNPQSSGTSNNLWSVDFVDASTGWIVGSSGRILKTANGGTTWTAQSSGTSRDLQAVSFANILVGWAVGSNGIILKTIDGGVTWNPQPTAPAAPTLFLPSNGGQNQPITLTFSWSNEADATSYRLQISPDPSFATTVFDDSTITVSQKQVGPLDYNTTYYWRVSAKNAAGASPYSPVWRFTTMRLMLPAAPALVSPSNGAGNQSTTLTLFWTSSAGATTYRLQVATTPTFTTTVFDDSTLTTTAQQIGPLTNNTIYYWRVNAKNAAGISGYSATWSFSTLGFAAPTLVSPPNNATNQPTTLTLVWNPSTGATTYRLQLATTPTFTTTAFDDSTITTTSQQVGPLNGNTIYYWRVNAKNAAGISGYSATWSFSTLGFAAPTLVSPPNNATNQPTTLTLVWNPSTGATTYRLQLATTPTFTTTAFDDSTITTTSQQVGPLNGNTIYYWRVNAKNAAGISGYSATWSFSTLGFAAPTLVSPPNNATNQPTTLTLVWNPSTGATTYRLQLATTPTFTTTVFDDSTITTTSQQVGPLNGNTIYYWRVNAKNAAETSSYSALWNFTTTMTAPSAPSLVSPLNGAINQPFILTLRWNRSTSAVTYRLQVSTTPSFVNTVFDDSTLVPTSRTIYRLNNDVTYYWRVKAKNALGESPYSEIWNFTIEKRIWGLQNSGAFNDLTSVSFVDTLTGWVVGAAGTILKTNDAGITWRQQSSGTNVELRSVHFIDTSLGWAVGIAGAVLKTTDGGEHWTPQTSGVSTGLNFVYFVNATTGWVAGDNGKILKTTDRGASWVAQTSGISTNLIAVQFVDISTGWALGSVLLRTSDGGANWLAYTAPNGRRTFHFIDATTGWAAGGGGEIFKTIDSGLSWQRIRRGDGNSLSSIRFIDAINGWAVGSFGQIIKTTDGGTNWIDQASGTAEDLRSVHFVNAKLGWAVGQHGVILKTPISSVVSVDENLEPNSTTPTDIVLEQNYPNPFNPSTTISFSLRRAEFVTLRVFNIRGEEVARLIEKQLAAGAHQVQWNASAFVSGVYCYRLQIRNLVQMRKLLLLK